MADYDLVIRGGTVVDGSGSAAFRGDVAVIGDRIVAVGAISGRGTEEIDAAGAFVTPGFVDVHTHYDGQITWENRLAPSTSHGVTTVVMGNCGVGFAPVRPTDHQLVIKLMEGVEDIPEVVMAAGVPWTWESFGDYLGILDGRVADADFAALLPHSPLRVYVMGERGANLEPPTESDLSQMRRLTAEAVTAGAIGVSTSRCLAHRFRSGEPAPSVPTEESELMALADGLRDAGGGYFQLIPNTAKPAADEFALMRRLNERSGRPLSFSLVQPPDRPDNWNAFLGLMAEHEGQGPPIYGQFYPRPIGILFGLDLSYHPFSLNPSFRPLAHLPLADKVRAMRDPEVRVRLIAEKPDDPNPFFLGVVQRTANLYALGSPPDYHQGPEQSIAARAAAAGVAPLELVYDDLLQDEGRAILYAPATPSISHNLDCAAKALDAPGAIVGLGDGGAHYGMICDAAYPTYLLTQWVRDGDRWSIPLEKAVNALSRKPALSVGMSDRGLIAVGQRADLNVIDLEALHLEAPAMAATLPAGGKRLTQAADGYVATILRGQVTYRDGQPTGALPGRLVRSHSMTV
jgi:N-acyl-D-amino-acid deacylase